MDEDDRRVVGLYTGLVKAHGHSHRALDWTSTESQTGRFRVLSDIGFAGGDSVLDVGCGLGDFLAWMRDNDLSDVRYTGVDMTPAMIDQCRTRFPGERFFVANILESRMPFRERRFDWVVASGIFAHRKEEPWDYMKTAIARMMDLAGKGVAFNSQSTLAGQPQYWTLFHADPEETLAYCQSFGWETRLFHTPDRTDFTVYMYRPADSEPPPRRRFSLFGFRS
ncbi:class I SAM-dependent methyltransferase [Phaeovibrio sulfidiphilus]|uniref:Class I SAM-dependent methyltransferase n=1 Tax=Phaeovibrio sulfidiphilus TaxID=1220600 RepID=A0A8J6YX47_9PROT|nr:class I SAM-dependent methyltransferase [Phaeovibrio sulfidiphilus]MBE1237287.1 class I SAM-dependent methyltransferase [Phaeovibrio sulfidiphilus]